MASPFPKGNWWSSNPCSNHACLTQVHPPACWSNERFSPDSRIETTKQHVFLATKRLLEPRQRREALWRFVFRSRKGSRAQKRKWPEFRQKRKTSSCACIDGGCRCARSPPL